MKSFASDFCLSLYIAGLKESIDCFVSANTFLLFSALCSAALGKVFP